MEETEHAFDEQRVEAAMSDADARIALILEATVHAFAADPSEPLYFMPAFQGSSIRHDHWPLDSVGVKRHDLERLEDVGMLRTSQPGNILKFWPTDRGLAVVRDAAGYVDRLADEAVDEAERSRWRQRADRLRAGDIAVGSTSGVIVTVLRWLFESGT